MENDFVNITLPPQFNANDASVLVISPQSLILNVQSIHSSVVNVVVDSSVVERNTSVEFQLSGILCPPDTGRIQATSLTTSSGPLVIKDKGSALLKYRGLVVGISDIATRQTQQYSFHLSLSNRTKRRENLQYNITCGLGGSSEIQLAQDQVKIDEACENTQQTQDVTFCLRYFDTVGRSSCFITRFESRPATSELKVQPNIDLHNNVGVYVSWNQDPRFVYTNYTIFYGPNTTNKTSWNSVTVRCCPEVETLGWTNCCGKKSHNITLTSQDRGKTLTFQLEAENA